MTTIAWDGDPLTTTRRHRRRTARQRKSFTIVVQMLTEYYPNLEYIFFKKEKSIQKQFSDVTVPYLDEDVAKKTGIRQFIGPIPHIKSTNTTIVTPESMLPPPMPGRNFRRIAFGQ